MAKQHHNKIKKKMSSNHDLWPFLYDFTCNMLEQFFGFIHYNRRFASQVAFARLTGKML